MAKIFSYKYLKVCFKLFYIAVDGLEAIANNINTQNKHPYNEFSIHENLSFFSSRF
jgi:hypothetical protein